MTQHEIPLDLIALLDQGALEYAGMSPESWDLAMQAIVIGWNSREGDTLEPAETVKQYLRRYYL